MLQVLGAHVLSLIFWTAIARGADVNGQDTQLYNSTASHYAARRVSAYAAHNLVKT